MKNIHLMKKSYAVLLVILIAAFFSCKKDSNKTPGQTDQEKLSGNWIMVDLQASAGGISGDAFSSVPSCVKDNVYQINIAGTYTINEEADICSPTTADEGTWSLLTNDTQLKFTGTSGEKLFAISNLTNDSVQLSYDDTAGGITTHYTATYHKQQ